MTSSGQLPPTAVNNIQYTLIIKLDRGKFPEELNCGVSPVTGNNWWASVCHWPIVRDLVFLTGLSD
jgi:hypothetical protein